MLHLACFLVGTEDVRETYGQSYFHNGPGMVFDAARSEGRGVLVAWLGVGCAVFVFEMALEVN